MKIRTFSVKSALSLVSGRLLCEDFGEVTELAEWIAGHPIWTHEYASETLHKRLVTILTSQHPVLGDAKLEILTQENFREWTGFEIARIGTDFLDFKQGTDTRTQSPVDTLKEMYPKAPVIIITKD